MSNTVYCLPSGERINIMESLLPALPVNFDSLAGQSITMLANILGSLAPVMVIYVLATTGLNYMKNAINGETSPGGKKPWEGHSDAMYHWYLDSIDRHGQEFFDKNAPDWVLARKEYEEIYNDVVKKKRRNQLAKMVEKDIEKEEADGSLVSIRKAPAKRVRKATAKKWFGDEENENGEETSSEQEDVFASLPY
jgi:hypothetical protein